MREDSQARRNGRTQADTRYVIAEGFFGLRRREVELFGRDPDSALAVRIAALRGELQRVLAGEPLRVEVIEHAVGAAGGRTCSATEGEQTTREVVACG